MSPEMHQDRKICDLPALLGVRRAAQAAGRTVVHCHGCFDIVHPGHIHHLQLARSLGDLLIVTVSADPHVNKGPARPLVPDALRAGSLAALECVDWVYVNPHTTAVELLEALRPDVYVKGKEYEQNRDPRFLAERDTVVRHGGRVVCSSGDVIFSSTHLIDQLGGRGPMNDYFNHEKLRLLRGRHGLTSAHLHGLVSRFRGKKVVVLGDYILDRYHFCDATGVAGESPMMSLRALGAQDYDGGAAVIALHLAGLGAEATLVTSLADDEIGRLAPNRLAAAGVEVQSLPRGRQSVCKHRYLVDQTKLFKVDEGQPSPLDSQSEQALADQLLAASEGAEAVIFADFGYGSITGGLLDRVMGELRRTVPILAADVSGQQSNLLRFRGVDLLCPTERELRATLHDFTASLPAVVWNLLHQTAAKQAIVTLGKQGLLTFAPPEGQASARLRSEYVPALCAHPIDPLGCGDALLATATLTLAVGGSLAAAALLGSLAAAVEVQAMGNQPLTSEMLLDCLALYEEPVPARLAS